MLTNGDPKLIGINITGINKLLDLRNVGMEFVDVYKLPTVQ